MTELSVWNKTGFVDVVETEIETVSAKTGVATKSKTKPNEKKKERRIKEGLCKHNKIPVWRRGLCGGRGWSRTIDLYIISVML